MTRLRVFAADDGANPVLDTSDPTWIGDALKKIGVRYERWPLRDTQGADAGGVLVAYAPEIDKLKAEAGYQSVDVISLAPDHPDRAALREKFLSEHRHSEDEVRFFVAGEGLFTLRTDDDRVHAILCTAGDLISVPAGMRHWFDMGPEPSFTAIRLFENPDGWVAKFTGDAIADRFPRHEPAAA
ncbi:MAG: 1,2-dihydroxy-3-keto-5-methylthiopentene dioxygenase [Sphingomonas sp.]|uniref:1,2-dihydroxy-3-keto-5-methylthiopentene dioxygenase n=1 Tax=Sphingomonas sp. TaxID=28214 RepID=UPI003F7D7591